MTRPGRMIMSALASAWIGCVGLAAEPGAPAAPAAAVPAEEASYHVPIFSTPYATVLRVIIPAKHVTSYHTHSRDLISVMVGEPVPEAYGRLPDGQLEPPRGGHLGEVSYNAYFNAPHTHINNNPGTRAQQVIAAVLKSDKPYGFTPESRDVPGYTEVLDNPRVRVWRLILTPGQDAAAITQQAPELRVAVRGGDLLERVPGKEDRGIWLRPGDVYWQEPGQTRALHNKGRSVIEFVEIEFK